jgi:hypothetical protein
MLKQRKKEFEEIEMRFINFHKEKEAKFKKELIALEKNSAVKKMRIRSQHRANAMPI